MKSLQYVSQTMPQGTLNLGFPFSHSELRQEDRLLHSIISQSLNVKRPKEGGKTLVKALAEGKMQKRTQLRTISTKIFISEVAWSLSLRHAPNHFLQDLSFHLLIL